jgi:ubiquinone/menaquinone biosynthesis C-methylase UbiE
MLDAEFSDPRLVEIYDTEWAWSANDDYFVALVNETPGARVLDLGCGTGRLALAIAAAGHRVTGIEPAPASLAAARAKRDSGRVTWIQGTARSAPDAAFDVALMTSHVAQVFIADDEWASVLADLRRALVPGGRLAFDSRDPRARAWGRWTAERSRRTVTLGSGGTVEIWTEVTNVTEETVSFTHRYRFGSGEELRSDSALRFRSEEQLRESLTAGGFTIENIYGGWKRQLVGSGDGELLVVARAER